jgi:glucosyl-3-phosphoglycerate phosphatase
MNKTIHCIRHGQSLFNAAFRETGTDPLLWDAPLSELGHRQVAETAARVRDVPYELILTSPLTRAIQTTMGLFASHPSADRIRVEHRHREHCENSCDVGRPPAALRVDFPTLDFGHLEEIWWHREGEPDGRGIVVEPWDALTRRVELFRAWLRERPERLIAVVGHGTFFALLTGQHLDNCGIAVLEL